MEIEAALATSENSANIRGLPDELLSLLIDDDTSSDIQGDGLDNLRYRSLEGQLMTWGLVFQYFRDTVSSLTIIAHL
jgi:hypothetical protein